MKKIILFLCILVINSFHYLKADDGNLPLFGRTYLAPRSQSTNAALEMVGWQQYINQPCKEWYGALTISPVYTHSFRPRRIAEYFFGTDELIISGSQVATRDNSKQILADYFGLTPYYQSTVFIKPEIRTFFIDFDWYLGYENYYLRIHAPYVWTHWNFNLSETPAAEPPVSNLFPALYMAVPAITAPAQSLTQALQGGITYGQVTEGLNFGLVRGAQSKHALSEVQIALGYNIANNYRGHAGFNIRGSIPTGTRPDGKFLFEPTIGNGHHGELGIGFTGHVLLWECGGEDKINLYADVNATHLFAARQRRSFDLNPITLVGSDVENFQGFASRYMLMKEFDINGNYIGSTVPVINRTTLNCDVRLDVEFDIAVMANYINPRWSVDFGYNGWIRTREKISNLEPIPARKFALKGIQNVAIGINNSNATQSTATIFGDLYANQAADADPNPPVFILPDALDLDSAANPFAFTNKFFGHIGYNWLSCHVIQPFIGIGGEVEFQALHPSSQVQPNKIAISQWGIWLKGGFGF